MDLVRNAIVLTTIVAYFCNGEEIMYVRPKNMSNTTCPGQPCELLDYYAGQTNYSNNTSFVFIPGLHTLAKRFEIKNVMNIQLTTMQQKEQMLSVDILCKPNSGFVFENVQFLSVKHLSISSCGQKMVPGIYNITRNDHFVSVAVALRNIDTLRILSTTIRDSIGYGIAANGLYGYSKIENCTLVNNTGLGNSVYGGNFALKYEKCQNTNNHVNVSIIRSQFLNGNPPKHTDKKHYQDQSHQDVIATGISLILSCTNVTICISKVTIANDKLQGYSSKGGNFFAVLGNTENYTSNEILIKNSNIVNGTAITGGGGYVKIIQPYNEPEVVIAPCTNIIRFENVNFTSNLGQTRGGALYILYEKASMYEWCPEGHVYIKKCHFTDNMLNSSTADSGVAIKIVGYSLNGVDATSFPLNLVNITRSHFIRNKLLTNYEHLVRGGAAVYISHTRRETFIVDCNFINNSITAIAALRSNIVFGGNVTIRNNSALDGGGLVLCQSSYILFAPNTTVTFEQNKAVLSGGGIHAEDQCLQSEPLCFYQVYSPYTKSGTLLNETEKKAILDSIKVIMINNIAGYAGSQIFGGSMDKCATTFIKNNTEVYNKIFREDKWDRNQNDHSYITSFPRQVCFCENNIPNCNTNYNQTIYPGQSFDVSLVGVGQFNHPVPATILANCSAEDTLHYAKRIKSECTFVKFKVHSTQYTEFDKLTLSVSSDLGYSAGSSLRSININYKNCPLGTHIYNSSCFLQGAHFNFSVDNSKIQKSEANVWVGYYNATSDNNSLAASGFIEFQYCPLGYCANVKMMNVTENNFSQDSQCDRRQGVLCGECAKDYSLAIASKECVSCSTKTSAYISILILATLAITVIVLLFMLCCNVTVTEGTINGLLFYISVYNINRHVFLRESRGYTFLSIFFAWINLDIGLETCLTYGFDTFWQTILTFFIPFFIWCVLGFVIFIVSKSSRITQMVGSNPVKVLATLILISYTKLLQAEVTVFSCTSIQYPSFNSSTPRVYKYHWLADGNVLCWQGKHLVLVVIGILFGVPTVLYTLTLLFIQPLQRYSHVRGLRWVAKLKPFFDAYTSPHVIKPHYRFWTGLLLLFRFLCTLLFTLAGSNHNIYKHYSMVVIVIGILILCFMHLFEGVYKKTWLYALNASFYLNMTFLSLLTFYSQTKGPSSQHSANNVQNFATYTSLSIVFVTVVAIMLYHVYKRSKETGLLDRCTTRLQETGCWRVVRQWKSRVRYIRLPQEDPQDRETHDDFDGERLVDDDTNWEGKLDEQNKEITDQGLKPLECVCNDTYRQHRRHY